MKNILFVSISFPPKNDPEALQTAKYFHYLQQHKDLQIDVVTSAMPTLYSPYDKTLEPYAVGIRQLIEIPLKENRYINMLRSRLGLQETVFPDTKESFHKQYSKALKALKEKPDLIYSRSDPKSSTIMAYKLKEALNVPWILHMSDPWADCPLQKFTGSYYKKQDEWERKCIEAADIVTLTSIHTIKFYKKKYPGIASKFKFYPNVFEHVKEGNSNGTGHYHHKEKFRVVYTGGIVVPRNPSFYLKPLSEIYSTNPDVGSQMEVIFAGEADAIGRAEFRKYKLPFVKWIGRVSYKEAIMLQKSADYLLITDNPVKDPEMSMFFSSKILDYMAAQKRILALTVQGSATDIVVKDLKGDVCDHEDVNAIKQSFLNALHAFRKGDRDYLINEHTPEKYEASYNANRLYKEIMTLLDA